MIQMHIVDLFVRLAKEVANLLTTPLEPHRFKGEL